MVPIREWRNDQMRILRQKQPLGVAEQLMYFAREVRPDFAREEPGQVLLAMDKDEELVGYGGLTRIDWESRRAELSFLTPLKRSLVYGQDFRHFLALAIEQVAFKELDFHRVWHESYLRHEDHEMVLVECGFRREGVLKDHVCRNGRYVDSKIYARLRNAA